MIFKIISIINIGILKIFGRDIYVSPKAKFRGLAFFYVAKNAKVLIGDVTFGSSLLNPTQRNINKFIVGNGASLCVGNNVGFSGVSVGCYSSIIIGNNVVIGGDVLIIDSNFHSSDYLERRSDGGLISTKPIIINNDVFIGTRSIILKGAVVGERAIIGAGSVVRAEVKEDSKFFDRNHIG